MAYSTGVPSRSNTFKLLTRNTGRLWVIASNLASSPCGSTAVTQAFRAAQCTAVFVQQFVQGAVFITLQHRAVRRNRQEMRDHAKGNAIGDAQCFHPQYRLIGGQLQVARHAGRRGRDHFPDHFRVRGNADIGKGLRKTRPASDAIVQQSIRDEYPHAMLPFQQTFRDQFVDCAAQGMAVHPEARGQLPFRRQPVPGRALAHILAFQYFGDLRVQCNSGVAVNCIQAHGDRCLDM